MVAVAQTSNEARTLTLRRFVDRLLAVNTESEVALRELAVFDGLHSWGDRLRVTDLPGFGGDDAEEAAEAWLADPANRETLTRAGEESRAAWSERDRMLGEFAAYIRTLQRVAHDARPEEDWEDLTRSERHAWEEVGEEDARRLRDLLDGDSRTDWFTWTPEGGLAFRRPEPNTGARRLFPLLARAAEVLWDAILGHYGFELRRCEWERCRQGRNGGRGLFVATNRGTRQVYCCGSCKTLANRQRRS